MSFCEECEKNKQMKLSQACAEYAYPLETKEGLKNQIKSMRQEHGEKLIKAYKDGFDDAYKNLEVELDKYDREKAWLKSKTRSENFVT